MFKLFTMSCFIFYFGLLVIARNEAKAQNHNRVSRFKSNLVERLLENTKPAAAPVSSEKLNCLSCLLHLYLDKETPKTETRSVHIRKPTSNSQISKSKQKLSSPLSSFGRSLNSLESPKSNFLNNYQFRRPSSSGGENLPLVISEKDYLADYSDLEPEKTSYEDFQDNYIDELSNDLSAYSAQSDYFSNKVEKELDYTDHLTSPHEEMCKTRKTWKLLNETRNQKGQIVRVLPRTHEGDLQFVYIYECVNTECERCRGVDHNSRCRMRESYLNLYHEVNGIAQYGYVVVPTHCTCELLPHHFYSEACSNNNRDRIKRK